MPQLKNAQILLSQMTSVPEPEAVTEPIKRMTPSNKKDLRVGREIPIADTLDPSSELEKTAVPTVQDEKENDNGD